MALSVDLLRKTFQETQQVIDRITPEQMANATPCSEWDVRALLNHTVGAVQMFAICASGGELPPLDFNAPPPDAIGADPAGAFRQAAASALAAWSAEGALNGTVTLPPGEMPAAVAMGVNLVDTYIHAWDIAKATGQEITLDPEVSTAALETAKAVLQPQFRQPGGPFGPEVVVPDDASAGNKLLAFAGRQP